MTYSNLQPGRYILRVVASNSREDKVVERREIEINADSDFCTIHLINDGVKVNGDSVEVYFAGMGSTDSYYCWMKNNRMGFNCKLSYELLFFFIQFYMLIQGLLAVMHGTTVKLFMPDTADPTTF